MTKDKRKGRGRYEEERGKGGGKCCGHCVKRQAVPNSACLVPDVKQDANFGPAACKTRGITWPLTGGERGRREGVEKEGKEERRGLDGKGEGKGCKRGRGGKGREKDGGRKTVEVRSLDGKGEKGETGMDGKGETRGRKGGREVERKGVKVGRREEGKERNA